MFKSLSHHVLQFIIYVKEEGKKENKPTYYRSQPINQGIGNRQVFSKLSMCQMIEAISLDFNMIDFNTRKVWFCLWFDEELY